MQTEAAAAKADGVVSEEIHKGRHRWQSHVIEFFAIGLPCCRSRRTYSMRNALAHAGKSA